MVRGSALDVAGGTVTHRVAIDRGWTIAAALGGPDGRTLYMVVDETTPGGPREGRVHGVDHAGSGRGAGCGIALRSWVRQIGRRRPATFRLQNVRFGWATSPLGVLDWPSAEPRLVGDPAAAVDDYNCGKAISTYPCRPSCLCCPRSSEGDQFD
jgi:hypothetical protein